MSEQATATWKVPTDLGFITTMQRFRELYDQPPADGRVVRVDDFGPLNLLTRPGKAWRSRAASWSNSQLAGSE